MVARLDISRLAPEAAQVEAEADAQRALVAKLHAGNRPQEIAQAKAALDAASADARDARSQYERASESLERGAGQAAVSRQDVDNAKAAMDAADAKVDAQRKAYELERIGPRREDIEQAEAQLRADEAQLAVLKRQLADAALVSPVTGVVRARLMEPGEMASPQRPVFTIAETDPKWVRAYVSETDLAARASGHGRHRDRRRLPGPRASRAGSASSRRWPSSRPKTVQTTELRTSLVYEVRVFVDDPGDELRLGMPATVTLQACAPGGRERS